MTHNTFEDRLRSLAARGFGISVSVNTPDYGEFKGKVKFVVALRKGRDYGGANVSASGEGLSLDEAAEDALRAAEAFLGDPVPPAAVRGALSDMATANLLPGE